MLSESEIKVFERISFTNRILEIDRLFTDDGFTKPIFKKKEIQNIFRELNEPFEIIETSYSISRNVGPFRFVCSFDIIKNTTREYYLLYKNGTLCNTGFKNIAAVLRELPYDKNMINNNFGLNTLDDLKSYIQEQIKLFELFVKAYCEEWA